jgi:hypothetical protein
VGGRFRGRRGPERRTLGDQRLTRAVQASSIHTGDANRQHYQVPPAFFGLVLGRRLKYSCCYWPEGVHTIDEAEEAMLGLTCARARLRDGMAVLDLGCGWGSLSLRIVRLVEVEGNVLRIQDVDIVDGTPLLDIKPYVPQFSVRDDVEVSVGWLEDNVQKLSTSRDDGRFAG